MLIMCLILCYLHAYNNQMLSYPILSLHDCDEKIYYKSHNFYSVLFHNMYISSCITCLYVYKLENKV